MFLDSFSHINLQSEQSLKAEAEQVMILESYILFDKKLAFIAKAKAIQIFLQFWPFL